MAPGPSAGMPNGLELRYIGEWMRWRQRRGQLPLGIHKVAQLPFPPFVSSLAHSHPLPFSIHSPQTPPGLPSRIPCPIREPCCYTSIKMPKDNYGQSYSYKGCGTNSLVRTASPALFDVGLSDAEPRATTIAPATSATGRTRTTTPTGRPCPMPISPLVLVEREPY